MKEMEVGCVVSSGVILVYSPTVDGEDDVYLLCQRRDTIAYVEFLRGTLPNEKLEYYFTFMTANERKRLQEYSFEKLWDDLNVNKYTITYRKDFDKAQEHFMALKNIELNEVRAREALWSLPKGRAYQHETMLETALREFHEETHINLSKISILTDPPVVDNYIGTDDNSYQTNYFLAMTDEKILPRYYQLAGIRTSTVSDEMADLRWCSLKEAQKLLADHQWQILNKCANILKKKKLEFRHKPFINFRRYRLPRI
jgi:8-oxo-dGTP pyrophosphatase MutT (NUDIX family)